MGTNGCARGASASGPALKLILRQLKNSDPPYLVIRPLSGTSSFSDDIVRFTNFFVYNGDRICLNKSNIFWGIKI